jgi:hypothetical protein
VPRRNLSRLIHARRFRLSRASRVFSVEVPYNLTDQHEPFIIIMIQPSERYQ